MNPNEWLDREIDAGRLPESPPDEALSLAADVLGTVPVPTTKTPGQGIPSVFINVEGGRASATSNTA